VYLIKFEQPNCAPCRAVDQFLVDHNVPAEKIAKLMAFDHPDEAHYYSIMSVPVVILLDDNNNEVSRSVGYKPVELATMVAQVL
jgi:thioredoxin 1